MAKKVQLPVIGGVRKVVQAGTTVQSTATTIAGLENQVVSIAQLRALLGITSTQTPNTIGAGVGTGFIVVGPGLSGGGSLVGTVPINLTAPIPAFVFEDGGGGGDGDAGPPGLQGITGLTGAQGPVGPAVFFLPDDPEPALDAIPGSVGPTGSTGAPGPMGAAIFLAADDGEDGDIGPPGPQGPAGSGGSGSLTLIGKATAASSVSSLTISSIPSTYSALQIVVSGRCTGSSTTQDMILQFNGDTGSNYSNQVTLSFGTTVAGVEELNTTAAHIGAFTASSAPSNRAGVATAFIPDYASTLFDKAGTSNSMIPYSTSSGGNFVESWGFVWFPSTPVAISSITIAAASGNIVAGSYIAVYGLA